MEVIPPIEKNFFVIVYQNKEKEFVERTQKMKEGIHPEYKKVKIKCVCGNEIEAGSTEENIKIENLNYPKLIIKNLFTKY